MKKFKTEERAIDVHVSTICDRCGHESKIDDGIEEPEMIQCHHQFSYASKLDGDMYTFDLCERCFLEVIETSGIKPSIMRPYQGVADEES